eukprot:m.174914 g.174914  ORF g.174914 m.174914 type:complete len:92 (+) comp25289_c0_seq1:757-1032(+)
MKVQSLSSNPIGFIFFAHPCLLFLELTLCHEAVLQCKTYFFRVFLCFLDPGLPLVSFRGFACVFPTSCRLVTTNTSRNALSQPGPKGFASS